MATISNGEVDEDDLARINSLLTNIHLDHENFAEKNKPVPPSRGSLIATSFATPMREDKPVNGTNGVAPLAPAPAAAAVAPVATGSAFQIVFLGTGVSTAIPSIRHILDMETSPCPVCSDAMNVPGSKNKRNNVSIGIIFTNDKNEKKCILVDVGKTLRDTCLGTFVKYSINEVNAILITHGHADAIMGIDDLRDLQYSRTVAVPDKKNPAKSVVGFQIVSGPMNIYLTEETMQTVSGAFPYLTTCQPCYLDKSRSIFERRVAYLNFNIIKEFDNLNIEDMPIRSFPVYHGGTYVSLGFSIGKEGEFIYISDVKLIPPDTMNYLKSIPQIKYLVIDVLNWKGIFSHMGLDEAIEVAKELKPLKIYFTGMTCGMGFHDEIELKVQRQFGENYYFAYDGLCIKNLTRK